MKFTKAIQYMVAIASMFLLMGCPYSSNVPLSVANKPAPDYLIGKWVLTDDTSESESYTVSRIDANTLQIVSQSKNDETLPEQYKGFITVINGKTFLNLESSDTYSGDVFYYFYLLEHETDSQIKLTAVTANIRETFTDSKELNAFFAANMHNSYFYDAMEQGYSKVP